MYHFTYWLEHFKGMPLSKAQTICKALSSLSEKTTDVCASTGKLTDCKSRTSFFRARQAIVRIHGDKLSQTEKTALSLFGDYIDFREYSSFKFPEMPTTLLVEYCKSMQMSYSYKAVLIHELISDNTLGVSADILVKKMQAFYQDRINHGLVAEKEDSVFSKPTVSFSAAKRVIISNPVKVLVDAKVITWDKRTGIISFTSEFLPATKEVKEEVRNVCENRIKQYYSVIKAKKETVTSTESFNSKKIETLLLCLGEEIQNTADKVAKKKLAAIHESLCNELGMEKYQKGENTCTKKKENVVSIDSSAELTALDYEDTRKVGALVQQTMELLEVKEYSFSWEQLKNMQSHEWSNTVLKLNYPFLKVVDESRPISEQRRDHLGNGRYYSRVFTFAGKKYLITSEWYARNKPYFIDWYNGLL